MTFTGDDATQSVGTEDVAAVGAAGTEIDGGPVTVRATVQVTDNATG